MNESGMKPRMHTSLDEVPSVWHFSHSSGKITFVNIPSKISINEVYCEIKPCIVRISLAYSLLTYSYNKCIA